MKRTAILGGAFDPPTANHMLGAAEVIHSRVADEVWLIPCGPRPDKPQLSKVMDRYIMTQISAGTAFSADFPVHVSNAELDAPEMIPTYDLLRGLRTRYPDREFSLVIGTDWLQPSTDIRQWTSKHPDTNEDIVTGHLLLSEFDFLVIPRPGYAVQELASFGPRMRWLEMPEGVHLMEGNLSSTEIRKRAELSFRMLQGPELVEGLVTPAVLGYISRQRLYHKGSSSARSIRPLLRGTPSCFSWFRRARQRNVAVFGGAFDPPTGSHILGLSEIIHAGVADEVLMVPCGPRPDKPHLRQPLTRYIMCQLAVNSSFSHGMPISVSDVEVFEPEALATYDSLRSIKARDPEARLMFVVGSDWLQAGNDIRQWTSKGPNGEPIVTGHKLVEEFDFLVIKRPGYEVQNLADFGPRMRWMDMPHGMKAVEANMSSTEVRKRAKRCYTDLDDTALQLIDGIVPPAVFSFVKRDAIYKQ